MFLGALYNFVAKKNNPFSLSALTGERVAESGDHAGHRPEVEAVLRGGEEVDGHADGRGEQLGEDQVEDHDVERGPQLFENGGKYLASADDF